jgi:hypothetical protein
MIAGMTSIERFALRMTRRHQRLSEIYFGYDLIVMPWAAYSPGKTKAQALNVAGLGSTGALALWAWASGDSTFVGRRDPYFDGLRKAGATE